MENDKELLTQNLYAIIGKKQVQLEAYQSMTQALQVKVQELNNKIKELKENGCTGSD
jgi:predicted outer membrane protein